MYHLISYYNIKNDKFIIHNTKEEIEKFLEKKESYLSFSIYKNLTKYKTPNSKFYRNEISSDFINTYNKNIFFNADYKINNYTLNENDKIVFFQLFNKRDRNVYKDALDNGTTPLCQIYLKNDGIYFDEAGDGTKMLPIIQITKESSGKYSIVNNTVIEPQNDNT